VLESRFQFFFLNYFYHCQSARCVGYHSHSLLLPQAEGGGLLNETIAPRAALPPLLQTLAQRPPEPLHWLGASFGITEPLYGFWHKAGFRPVYLRQVSLSLYMYNIYTYIYIYVCV